MDQIPDDEKQMERQVLKQALDLLAGLEKEARIRVMKTVVTYFDIPLDLSARATASMSTSAGFGEKDREQKFSGHPTLTPKEFMLEKAPHTDIDRVVCLGYYLSHYADTPHFKTADISTMNTEAAQRKLTNAAYSVNNAVQSGYFVAARGGGKQLSALGEQYVEALPDREAAKSAVARLRRPRLAKRQKSRLSKKEDDGKDLV